MGTAAIRAPAPSPFSIISIFKQITVEFQLWSHDFSKMISRSRGLQLGRNVFQRHFSRSRSRTCSHTCELYVTQVLPRLMHVVHESEVGVGGRGPLGCRAVVRLGLGLMWGSSAVLINQGRSMCRSCGVGLPRTQLQRLLVLGPTASSCSPPLNGRGQAIWWAGPTQPKPY